MYKGFRIDSHAVVGFGDDLIFRLSLVYGQLVHILPYSILSLRYHYSHISRGPSDSSESKHVLVFLIAPICQLISVSTKHLISNVIIPLTKTHLLKQA
jgi:hypothetical protein